MIIVLAILGWAWAFAFLLFAIWWRKLAIQYDKDRFVENAMVLRLQDEARDRDERLFQDTAEWEKTLDDWAEKYKKAMKEVEFQEAAVKRLDRQCHDPREALALLTRIVEAEHPND